MTLSKSAFLLGWLWLLLNLHLLWSAAVLVSVLHMHVEAPYSLIAFSQSLVPQQLIPNERVSTMTLGHVLHNDTMILLPVPVVLVDTAVTLHSHLTQRSIITFLPILELLLITLVLLPLQLFLTTELIHPRSIGARIGIMIAIALHSAILFLTFIMAMEGLGLSDPTDQHPHHHHHRSRQERPMTPSALALHWHIEEATLLDFRYVTLPNLFLFNGLHIILWIAFLLIA